MTEIAGDSMVNGSGFSSGIPRKVADSYTSPAGAIIFAAATIVIPRASAKSLSARIALITHGSPSGAIDVDV